MHGWLLAIILDLVLLPMFGLVYGVVLRPGSAYGRVVLVAVAGAIMLFWLAAGVLTVHAFF